MNKLEEAIRAQQRAELRVSNQRKEIRRLRTELAEEAALREKLAGLLRGVANGLNGKPPELDEKMRADVANASYVFDREIAETIRLGKETKRLRKLANRRARKCNALLSRLRDEGLIPTHDTLESLSKEIAATGWSTAIVARQVLEDDLRRTNELSPWLECDLAKEHPGLCRRLDEFTKKTRAENAVREKFKGKTPREIAEAITVPGRQGRERLVADLTEALEAKRGREPETVVIGFEELTAGLKDDPVVQAQLAKCRTCGGNGMTSGKCKACGAG